MSFFTLAFSLALITTIFIHASHFKSFLNLIFFCNVYAVCGKCEIVNVCDKKYIIKCEENVLILVFSYICIFFYLLNIMVCLLQSEVLKIVKMLVDGVIGVVVITRAIRAGFMVFKMKFVFFCYYSNKLSISLYKIFFL